MAHSIDLEFFYDCSSPWTYFAFTRMIPMARQLGVVVRWRPILVGGVFNAVNQQVYASREDMFTKPENKRKMDYYLKDLGDWAELSGVNAIWPANHPINSVKAMRGAFFAEEQGLLLPYSEAVFSAYWGGKTPDIASDEVLLAICQQVGLEEEGFFKAIGSQASKDMLRGNTDELIERGGFGSPTLFINRDDMYFGNDRIELILHKLHSS